MPIMKWGSNFVLGVEEIDRHHEHLVGLLNKTYDVYKSGESPESLGAVLDELIDYASYHFTAEEAWMSRISYPMLAEHKQEHETFSTKASLLRTGFHAGKAAISAEVFAFLAKWVTSHILESDALIGRYLEAKETHMGVGGPKVRNVSP